jgi:hypothetical protein
MRFGEGAKEIAGTGLAGERRVWKIKQACAIRKRGGCQNLFNAPKTHGDVTKL